MPGNEQVKKTDKGNADIILQAKRAAAIEISQMSPEGFFQKFPNLAEQLIKWAQARGPIGSGLPTLGEKSGRPCLTIYPDDPFIDGVIRFYTDASGEKPFTEPSLRPFVLVCDDPAAGKTLGNYLTRAFGACDTVRANIITKAISTFEAAAKK